MKKHGYSQRGQKPTPIDRFYDANLALSLAHGDAERARVLRGSRLFRVAVHGQRAMLWP